MKFNLWKILDKFKWLESMNRDIIADSVAFILDHLGVISPFFKNLELAEKQNQRLPRFDIRRIVSNGHAILEMVLNGLGFSNRRLYLIPQSLENKPLDLLISPNRKPIHFDEHVLGRGLDNISVNSGILQPQSAEKSTIKSTCCKFI